MLNGILNFFEQEAITIEGYLKNKVIRIKVTGKNARGICCIIKGSRRYWNFKYIEIDIKLLEKVNTI